MKRILRKTEIHISIECKSGFYSSNLVAKNISVEISEGNFLKLYFDCSKSKNLDSYDFERAEEFGSEIIVIDFYDEYLDKNLRSFIKANVNLINIEKVILNIRFINNHINELKFKNSFSILVKE